MTRKEAVANLNMISVAFVEPVTKEQRKLIDDTFDMAIKALEQETVSKESYEHEYFLRKEFEIKIAKLEQEPILDKIRAEVEALNQDYYCEGDFDKCKDYVLDILDKYRGES